MNTCIAANNDDHFLEGGCLEYAIAKKEENGGKLISVACDGYFFHIALKTECEFIDATGKWETFDEWISALKGAMKELFPEDDWDGVYEYHPGVVAKLQGSK